MRSIVASSLGSKSQEEVSVDRVQEPCSEHQFTRPSSDLRSATDTLSSAVRPYMVAGSSKSVLRLPRPFAMHMCLHLVVTGIRV